MARPTFRQHPKFLRLCHMLAMPAPHVYGHVEYLWDVTYQSGEPVLGDATDVELAAGWTGEPGKLCRALAECGGSTRKGLIESTDDGRWMVHDLYDHAPDYVKARSRREAERTIEGKTISDLRRDAANKRWKKDATDMQGYASEKCLHANAMQVNATESKTDANGLTPAPAPAPALNTPAAQVCPEPTDVPPASGPSTDAEPTLITFPCVPGRKSKSATWSLTPAYLAELSGGFPAVDVAVECRTAHVWLTANPTKKKTASGMADFLFRWMTRCQNRGGRSPPVPAATSGESAPSAQSIALGQKIFNKLQGAKNEPV